MYSIMISFVCRKLAHEFNSVGGARPVGFPNYAKRSAIMMKLVEGASIIEIKNEKYEY